MFSCLLISWKIECILQPKYWVYTNKNKSGKIPSLKALYSLKDKEKDKNCWDDSE